jgi:aldose 1-epimerase
MAITRAPFGQVGRKNVELFTLTGDTLTVKIMNYGGIIQQIIAPDRRGQRVNVNLGFDNLDQYIKESPFFGAIAGRVANRIAGGKFEIDGKTYATPLNSPPNKPVCTLHGGIVGFDKKVWDARIEGDALVLSLVSPDGEEGFPGAMRVQVTYSLAGDTLRVDYHADADAPTPINLTNHAYFNLAGAGRGDILNHVAMIAADRFTPTDGHLLPTGEIQPVKGTPYDFTQPATIGSRIRQTGGGYDLNYCLRSNSGGLQLAARVVEPNSGRVLEVSTTQPGIQLYTGNFLEENGTLTGLGGPYVTHGGLCLETQHYPDSVHWPHFPNTILRPGETYRHTTTFRFTTQG